MSEVKELEDQLNRAIEAGKAMEAFEQFYAEDVVMQENSETPRRGKDVNREFEQQFFASVAEFHGAKCLASAVNGDVAFSEWEFDITFKQGGRVKMAEAAVRRWKDGKVASERFYYSKPGQ